MALQGCCCLLLLSFNSHAQSVIQNKFYSVRPSADFRSDPAFIVTHKASGLERKLRPSLQLVMTGQQPELVPSLMDGQQGILAWKTKNGLTQDINALGSSGCIARFYLIKNNEILFFFNENAGTKISLVIKFTAHQQAPVFEIEIQAGKTAEYSLGFTGMPEVDSSDIDFVYQPLAWSWKRFPSRFALTEEAYANTAAVFTNHHGMTEGLAVSPGVIPYRFAYSAQWNNAGKQENKFWSVFPKDGPRANSLFGMAIRNTAGKAQPLVYAPLPGTATARLNKGSKYKIALVYLFYPGNWEEGVSYLLSSILHYKSERENATVSLNTTLDNMLEFAMNDAYSGWNKDLKASNYQFDAPGTVKNVSSLYPLSLAFITGDDDILRRRAIPMMEYVMSREKFLYTPNDTPHQTQSPSHLLKGPCVDIGELAALDQLTGGATSAFSIEATRLFGISRRLNMNTETGSGSWQDYLARYRLLHDPSDLQKAIAGANQYLQQVYYQYPKTFFDSPGLRDKGAGFTTDYGYRFYDLFELFLETRNDVYLQAALKGAKQFLLWTRSNPQPPAHMIKINASGKVSGIFPGRRVSAVEGSTFVPMDVTTDVPETEVPTWRTSLNGLIPEAPNTYAFGPVMLAHHAAWLLRLAQYSKDTLLRNAAYNAVIGRYENFPGYYFTSLHTDVYQKAGYPMRPFADVKYNAIFYNHVWPHLALLVDFLVADFNYRTDGRISFPGTFAPGYAFLSSYVYGREKGTMMGQEDIQLWLPPHALQSSGFALNHLMGRKGNDLFIAFANSSKKKAKEQVRLNQTIIPWRRDKLYTVIFYDTSGNRKSMRIKNGIIPVSVDPDAVICVQVKGILPAAGEGSDLSMAGEPKPRQNRFLRFAAKEDSTAISTAMIIQPEKQLAVFYTYLNKTEKDWKECSLRYRFSAGEAWTTLTDNNYPFEFDFTLPDPNTPVLFEIRAVKQDDRVIKFSEQIINQ